MAISIHNIAAIIIPASLSAFVNCLGWSTGGSGRRTLARRCLAACVCWPSNSIRSRIRSRIRNRSLAERTFISCWCAKRAPVIWPNDCRSGELTISKKVASATAAKWQQLKCSWAAAQLAGEPRSRSATCHKHSERWQGSRKCQNACQKPPTCRHDDRHRHNHRRWLQLPAPQHRHQNQHPILPAVKSRARRFISLQFLFGASR